MRAKLDQHFLTDAAVADRIVASCSPRAGDPIVEIGPGRGVLTERLLERGASVTAVEIDDVLRAGLAARLGERLRLVSGDFLEIDLAQLPSPAKVVSNLPYSMGTPILQRLLPWKGWTEAVLMFQKEVADRVCAAPGTRDYGVLTLSAAVYADAEPLFDVGRRSFSPPPKVESAVLRLRRLERPRLPDGLDPEAFLAIAKAAFSQRRKMAANSIASMRKLERPAVAAALERSGVSPTARAEEIPFDAFVRLALELQQR